jgi:hypothetical protein
MRPVITTILSVILFVGGVYGIFLLCEKADKERIKRGDLQLQEERKMMDDCTNYTYKSTIYNGGEPWRFIYTCEDGREVITNRLWNRL